MENATDPPGPRPSGPRPPGPRPPLGALGLVGASFRTLIAHFGFLFPLAFVPALALALLALFTAPPELPADFDPGSELPPLGAPAFALAFFLDILVSFVVTGVMALAALDAILGKRHTIGQYLAQVLRHLGPIVVLGLVLYVFAGIGFALLALPGLYILARFLPWVPAIVFENAGWSGLGRAQDLTAGYRWPIAGAILVFGLIGLGLVLVLAPLAAAVGAAGAAGGGLVAALVQACFTALTYALAAIFSALVYARLREIGEGATNAEIAASID